MKYNIKELSRLAGISSRTLRYYDEIDLLKPCEINSSNCRVYDEKAVDILQMILFYKELELPLEKIKSIIYSKDFDYKKALYDHKDNLLKKQQRIEILLNNVQRSIECIEGGVNMKDSTKFEGLKMKEIKENEELYGDEIREKYGEETVINQYKKFSNLSEEEYIKANQLNKEIIEKLKDALKVNDVNSKEAKEIVKLHKMWLSYYGNYTKEAHIGLGKMYVMDERFTKFYDNAAGKGAAQYLCNAIEKFYNL